MSDEIPEAREAAINLKADILKNMGKMLPADTMAETIKIACLAYAERVAADLRAKLADAEQERDEWRFALQHPVKDVVESLQEERDELRREVEALKADKERIDKLDANVMELHLTLGKIIEVNYDPIRPIIDAIP